MPKARSKACGGVDGASRAASSIKRRSAKAKNSGLKKLLSLCGCEGRGSRVMEAMIERVREERGWEASNELREALEAAFAPETMGRFAEELAESVAAGDARDALESSTLAKQAGVAIYAIFGTSPHEPRAVSGGWVGISDTGYPGPGGEVMIKAGTLLAQRQAGKGEWRLLLEHREWTLGARVSKAENGYASARICAYGKDAKARARGQAWFDAALPMSGYKDEQFFEPAPGQKAERRARGAFGLAARQVG